MDLFLYLGSASASSASYLYPGANAAPSIHSLGSTTEDPRQMLTCDTPAQPTSKHIHCTVVGTAVVVQYLLSHLPSTPDQHTSLTTIPPSTNICADHFTHHLCSGDDSRLQSESPLVTPDTSPHDLRRVALRCVGCRLASAPQSCIGWPTDRPTV